MPFEVGQSVALREDSTWIGGVLAVQPAVDGVPRYRVGLGLSVQRDYAEPELVAAPDDDSAFGWFRLRLAGYLDVLRSAPSRNPGHLFMRSYITVLAPPTSSPLNATPSTSRSGRRANPSKTGEPRRSPPAASPREC